MPAAAPAARPIGEAAFRRGRRHRVGNAESGVGCEAGSAEGASEGSAQHQRTGLVAVALQEFFNRYRVPLADLDGRIAEQES
jgi:hypothetical protein